MASRDIHIDTLRGLACTLLVAFHVIGVDANSGLEIGQGAYREVNDILAYIRMPLFTFLSGVVYAAYPFNGSITKFVRGKLRRLMLPMLSVGTLFAVLQHFVHGANGPIENWYLLHIKPVAHFWFLQAIFLIFMLIIPLEAFGILRSKKGYLISLLVASWLFTLAIYVEYFSVSGFFYLLPFFLLGLGLRRFAVTEYLKTKTGLVLIGLSALLLLADAFSVFAIGARQSVLGLSLGFVACVGLLSLGMRHSALANIGSYSYAIYLYHVFFTAGSRMMLQRLGIDNVHLLFILLTMAGIFGPILLEKVLMGTNLTRIVLLGKSKTKRENLWFTKRLDSGYKSALTP